MNSAITKNQNTIATEEAQATEEKLDQQLLEQPSDTRITVRDDTSSANILSLAAAMTKSNQQLSERYLECLEEACKKTTKKIIVVKRKKSNDGAKGVKIINLHLNFAFTCMMLAAFLLAISGLFFSEGSKGQIVLETCGIASSALGLLSMIACCLVSVVPQVNNLT